MSYDEDEGYDYVLDGYILDTMSSSLYMLRAYELVASRN